MLQGKKNKLPNSKPPKVIAKEETLPVSGGWAETLKELSPEAQAEEAERQRQRNEKAAIAAKLQQKQNAINEWHEKERQKNERKKHQEDRKWESKLAKDRQRALDEGILEAREGTDGLWYVQLEPKIWRECSGQYFCRFCEKHLNDLTLSAHLDSDGHRKKREWFWPPSSNTPSSKPPTAVAPRAAPSTPWCAPCSAAESLEDWQELGADGYVRCIPCGKMCDGSHENTAAHLDKLEWWRYRQETEKNGYEAPALEYLAYVPFDEEANPNGHRMLRCLMCKKWVHDDWSHIGTHANPDGSKEHQKNLRNYGPGNPWWEEEVVKVRQRWHPVQKKQAASKRQAALAPWATAEHVASASSNTTTRQPERIDPLDGWTAHEDNGHTFYFHAASGTSQWEVPVDHLEEQSRVVILPEGWRMLTDDQGNAYYWNEASNETQWEPPQSEDLSWREAKDEEGNTYYYHTKTGESTWDKPESF